MNLTIELSSVSSAAADVVDGFLPLFYLVPPSRSMFNTTTEVPKYVEKAVPYFMIMILFEAVIRWLQGLPKLRVNDSIGSITAGILMAVASDVMLSGIEVILYSWIYEHYRVYELPWDSAITWYICFLAYDCAYYWFHRMAHEVNIFWATHQVHHSSEEYNLTTALRQSTTQKFNSLFFYIPLALCIPPTAFFVHKQFNLLYQFWIHTEIIGTLGPLEWVLNTPSHHRVHHGRNRYCIDKNYAGVLIIWDRMFGTFQSEKEGTKIHYGLVHNIKSYNPIWIQIHHFVYIIKRVWNTKGLCNKLSVLWKGPGWTEGLPRLGKKGNVPEVPEDTSLYNPTIPLWVTLYCVIHFIMLLTNAQFLAAIKNDISYLISIGIVLYIVLCVTNFGLMFDQKPVCAVLEVARLIFLLVIDAMFRHRISSVPVQVFQGLQCVHGVSLLLWCTVLLRIIKDGYCGKSKVT